MTVNPRCPECGVRHSLNGGGHCRGGAYGGAYGGSCRTFTSNTTFDDYRIVIPQGLIDATLSP